MLQLRNHMEEVVYSQVEDILKGMDMCKCEKCRMDIAALALNELPPKYIVTDKGVIFSKIDSLQHQFNIVVTAAVTKAVMSVRSSPRHDTEA